MGGDAITEMARQLVRRHPTHPARSLARRLVEEANGAITLEQARYRIRAQFGQSGKRGKPAAKRAARKPGQGVAMPPSKAEKWEPYVLETTGIVGILSDIHVPFHSEVALQAAVGHFKTVGIDALILNGDTCDFYAISRWIKDPKKRDFRGEITAATQLLAWLRQEFPGVPIIFKAGNHEERWKHWLWQHAPEISDDPRMGLDQWLDSRRARHRAGRRPTADYGRRTANLARPRKRERHQQPCQPGTWCVFAAAAHGARRPRPSHQRTRGIRYVAPRDVLLVARVASVT
jgi:hypothetical protein